MSALSPILTDPVVPMCSLARVSPVIIDPVVILPPETPGACDPLRIGLSWVQYGAGFGASDISQYDDADPIVFRQWTYAQTVLNPAGFTATGPDVSYFYDEFGTWPLSLFVQTASGQVRTLSTTTPIVTPYDNSTALPHVIFATVAPGGLPFCSLAPASPLIVLGAGVAQAIRVDSLGNLYATPTGGSTSGLLAFASVLGDDGLVYGLGVDGDGNVTATRVPGLTTAPAFYAILSDASAIYDVWVNAAGNPVTQLA